MRLYVLLLCLVVIFNNMKILILGEASFVHSTLRDALRSLGHDVILVSDGNNGRGCPRDIDVERNPRWGKLGGLMVLWKLLVNIGKLRGNDVVLIHNYQFVPLKARWNALILDFLKRNNRLIAKGCYGDDPQVLERQLVGVPRYSDMYWRGEPQNIVENAARLAEQRLPEIMEIWRKSTDEADVLLPCLYEYYLSYDVEPFRHKLVYMPLPIEIPQGGVHVKGIGKQIKVLVGVQSKRDYIKGARKIGEMVEEVARRNPGRLDIRYVEDVPYNEYYTMLDDADVQVDQLYSFTPSMNSLAAMARGTVVIGGGEEDFYDFIGEKELRPIINVSPEKSFEDNVKAIEAALIPEGNVERLSRQSIEFIRRHNDSLKVAECHIELYHKLLGN